MKLNKLFYLVGIVSLVSGCSPTKSDPCEDGCQVEANYICDMVCPDCGKLYKKLESKNTVLNLIEECNVNYKENLVYLYQLFNNTYSILQEAILLTPGTTEFETKIAELSTAFATCGQEYMNFFMNEDYDYARELDSIVYGDDRLANAFSEASSQMDYFYAHLGADIYYSSVGNYVIPSDPETDAYFSQYKGTHYDFSDNEYNSLKGLKKATSRISELKSYLSNVDSSTVDANEYYNNLYEYMGLVRERAPQGFNSYYEYLLKKYNGEYIDIDKAKEYFEFFRTNGQTYYSKLKELVDNDKYSDAKKFYNLYNTPGKNTENDNVMQDVVNYMKTIKNDSFNMFDSINSLYEEGYVFSGTNLYQGGSCNYTTSDGKKIVVFTKEDNTDPKTYVHEFGHYIDTHASYTLFNEFTSTAQEILFNTYLYNNYETTDKNAKKYLKDYAIYDNYQYALYYALYEEIASCLYSDYSSIDPKYEDGISNDEIKDFFKDIYSAYGMEVSDYKVIVCIKHIITGGGYEFSYCANALTCLNILFDAYDNYDNEVSKYIAYLQGTSDTDKDIESAGFTLPNDSNLFTLLTSKLDKYFSK